MENAGFAPEVLERQARPYSKAALLQKAHDARADAKAAASKATDAATFARELAEKMETAYATVSKALETAREARLAQEVAEERHRKDLATHEHVMVFARAERDGARRWNRRLALTVAVQSALSLAYLVWGR